VGAGRLPISRTTLRSLVSMARRPLSLVPRRSKSQPFVAVERSAGETRSPALPRSFR
jgi:hypothetical protein